MDGGKFFGAFRACSGISDAVVLNHVPVGCSWGAGMFKTVSNQPDIRHACTVMHEREIVFGGENALKEALVRADRLYDASLLLVVAGDVPSIIGDDIEAVINSVSLKKDVVWVDAAGFQGTMRQGYESALLSLADLMKECDRIQKSVNLIGLCQDDYKAEADIKEIKRLLNGAGISVNCVISDCTSRELERAPAAELNVVIGQGYDLARHMQKEHGVPFIEVGYPYGLAGTKEFVDSICQHMDMGYDLEKDLNTEPFRKVYLNLSELYGTPVSVIGDFHAKSLADFLDRELGFEIEVLSSVEGDPDQFEQDVKGSNTTMLFGSSFEQKIARDLKIPLLRFSYPVFDQVCIYDEAPYAGIRGAVCLTEAIINAIMGFGDKLENLTMV
ncbi:MAG: light-independent protochlorophyllide reductase subunit B [Methanosaeta sp. PtaU1.Bin112]|nr:MAG: light-independent protochlorophyllide reductase subunit B [Methanosaeta sp. PtaU1.Bin112]